MQARILDGDKIRTTTELAEIRAALAAGQRTWVDLERQSVDADTLLAEVLRLHPLTIEDIWAERSRPKIDDFDEYLYVIVHGIGAAKGRTGWSPTTRTGWSATTSAPSSITRRA
jgi:Mg2+ and Co2+ transporter CorA